MKMPSAAAAPPHVMMIIKKEGARIIVAAQSRGIQFPVTSGTRELGGNS
jgi:hypothetical protein